MSTHRPMPLDFPGAVGEDNRRHTMCGKVIVSLRLGMLNTSVHTDDVLFNGEMPSCHGCREWLADYSDELVVDALCGGERNPRVTGRNIDYPDPDWKSSYRTCG